MKPYNSLNSFALCILLVLSEYAYSADICYAVTCETLSNICAKKSDLEMTITLSDNCSNSYIS